jgi:predicted transcriptional regulator
MVRTVADVMERNVHTIHCQSSILEAEAILLQRRISAAPMVSTDGFVLGVVTITDVTRFRHEHAKEDPADRLVFEIGTPITATIDARASLRDAAREMSDNQVHRLVVVSGGVPVGIIGALDLVAQIAVGGI